MSNNIAIIPARSGSKGLPDKNIKELHGKPMLAYTIEAAQQSNCFEEIFVSTDSIKYAEIAKNYGASVPFFRSNDLASDVASTWDVVMEALNWYKENRTKEFSKVCVLQPTSPLRDGNDIYQAFKLFKDKKAKTVSSVCLTDHPSHIVNRISQDLSLYNFIKQEDEDKRRQDLGETYRLNGAIYIRLVEDILSKAPVYPKESYAYIMSKHNSIDIDDYIDFLLADTLLKYKEGNTSD